MAVISSQHYRLPVRRYILELFDVKLDDNVVTQMASYEQDVEAYAKECEANPQLQKAAKQDDAPPNRGDKKDRRKSRPRRDSPDSEEDLDAMWEEAEEPAPPETTTLKLKPLTRIVGFDAGDSD
jgi:large subunit ribosomal protein L17e